MGHETCGRFGQEIAARKLRHCIYCHGPDLIRLADHPSALQTADLRRHSPGELESGVISGGRTARPPAWGRPGTTHSGGVLLAPLPEQRKGGFGARAKLIIGVGQ
jgi:mono/diheme cytochrome c family protein